MTQLTIFSLNLNNHIQNDLQKLCIDSWYRCKDELLKDNVEIDIKVFNEDDAEWIEFYKKYNTTLGLTDIISHKADLFRIYILSKYENYCWLDTDVYIYDSKKFFSTFNNFIFKKGFWSLSSGKNTNYYKSLFDNYTNDKKVIRLCDGKVVNYLKLTVCEFNLNTSGIVHLKYIDDYINGSTVPLYIFGETYSRDDLLNDIEEIHKGITKASKLRKRRIVLYKPDCTELFDPPTGIYIPNDDKLIKFLRSIGINI